MGIIDFRAKGLASPLLVACLLVSGVLSGEPVTYTDAQGNRMTFDLGDSAFADSVADYAPGEPGPGADAANGGLALGAPNYGEPGDGSYATLGCGGSLTLQFTDNILVDQPGPDLHVFEVGPDVEPTAIAISADGENWQALGQIDGGDASVDIAEYIDSEATFRFVRLTDDGEDCHGRWPGADIDALGALNAAQLISLAGELLFDTDSAALRASARNELERIGDRLRDAEVDSVRIVGHTDSRGPADYNRRLSLERAEAVRAFLAADLGLESIEFVVEGAGESRPVAGNDTSSGRQRNRRVEFIY